MRLENISVWKKSTFGHVYNQLYMKLRYALHKKKKL